MQHLSWNLIFAGLMPASGQPQRGSTAARAAPMLLPPLLLLLLLASCAPPVPAMLPTAAAAAGSGLGPLEKLAQQIKIFQQRASEIKTTLPGFKRAVNSTRPEYCQLTPYAGAFGPTSMVRCGALAAGRGVLHGSCSGKKGPQPRKGPRAAAAVLQWQ